MSYLKLVGSKFSVSTGFATATNITDITNTAPPVVSSAAHGMVDGDEALILDSWEDFSSSVFRINQLTTGTLDLPGYDATDTVLYPQGSENGTIAKVTGWQEIGQVLSVTNTGGGPRTETIYPYERRNGVIIDLGFEPASMTMTLGWNRTRTDQIALATASRVRGKRAFRYVLNGPTYCYGYGTVSMSEAPKFENVMKVDVQVNFDGWFTAFI